MICKLFILLHSVQHVVYGECQCGKKYISNDGTIENVDNCLLNPKNARVIESDKNFTTCSVKDGPTCCMKSEENEYDVDQKNIVGTWVEISCLHLDVHRWHLQNYCGVNNTHIRRQCCCDSCEDSSSSECNICPEGGYNFTLTNSLNTNTKPDNQWTLPLVICTVCIIAIGLLVYFWYTRCRCRAKGDGIREYGDNSADVLLLRLRDETSQSGTTGQTSDSTRMTRISSTDPNGATSGAGPEMLTQQYISRTVTLGEEIGRGRFGKVNLGRWQGRDVAVKIIDSRDDASWMREVEIYHSNLINHANILQLIASDNKDTGTDMQLWLITDYHERGSLYDCLNRGTNTIYEAIVLVLSATEGIDHLHKAIHATANHSKKAVAHRDIKSKNILVKNDGQCVIADFGLAVTYDASNNEIDFPKDTQDKDKYFVGTMRYMCPELLSGSFGKEDFTNFKWADMYSFGLVIWEILSRTEIYSDYVADKYKVPYDDHAPSSSDPSRSEMRRIVSEQGIRPTLADFSALRDENLKLYTALCSMCKYMNECLAEKPTWRVPALRIKKALYDVMKDLKTQKTESSSYNN